jgi:hypothetical protein
LFYVEYERLPHSTKEIAMETLKPLALGMANAVDMG